MTKKPREPRDPTDMSDPLYDSAKDPTSPFYEGNKTEGEPKPGSSDKEAYKVGPGFPPSDRDKTACPLARTSRSSLDEAMDRTSPA